MHWFCKLKGNEYFVEVDEDFIKKEENSPVVTSRDSVQSPAAQTPSRAVRICPSTGTPRPASP
ncbi:MAG: hypothetical protein II670_02645, partial [Alphaproteobacteria bacterium]|nr:hypothetical protein [Alphaproteobacteria bacterium]